MLMNLEIQQEERNKHVFKEYREGAVFCISEKIAFGQHTTLFRYYIMPVAYLLLSVVM